MAIFLLSGDRELQQPKLIARSEIPKGEAKPTLALKCACACSQCPDAPVNQRTGFTMGKAG